MISMTVSKNTIGSNIKSRRKNQNLSQEQLASNAGIKYSNLVKIENSLINKPSVHTIYRIAKSLDTTVENLIEAK
ncbi:MAG: hypothetical protein COU65_00785 [Candidatus Pacebacteria bacterium CG10_big_fil_rev_8_21_14_0_10_42_12]|nr:MAG: hypothetical protein COU65_00785 [Candidatus Pacebacteria bacterium CG10_big_fil_rev_8_21_14_0_10_42_12]